MPLALSVVIPTHRRAEALWQILPPVLSAPATAEVIVVVDGADPATIEVLEAMPNRDGRLRWSVLDPNQGLVRARCHGTRLAAGEVVLMLDDDVRSHDGLASGHLAHHEARDHLIVVGAMHVDLALPRSALGRVVARNYEKAYATAVEEYEAHPAAILDGLWGGNVSVPRSDLLAMEADILQSPSFAHEDMHMGLVAKVRGMTGIFDPDLVADHLYFRDWAGMLSVSEAFGRAQRTMAQLHPHLGPFEAASVPEPLNPLVEMAVRASDRPWVARLELAVLKATTWASEVLGARRTAERLAFAASQIARRRGRRAEAELPQAAPLGAGDDT